MSDKDMTEFTRDLSNGVSTKINNPFARFKETWSRTKDRLQTPRVRESAYSDPIMPESIRYALAYKEGRLGGPEIRTLIGSGLTDLGTYALLKSLTSDPEGQQHFLEEFVDTVVDYPDDLGRIQDVQIAAYEQNIRGKDVQIAGAKVAQIIRQGVSLWDEKFTELAKEVEELPQDVTPVYMAYAATLGLRQGLNAYRGSQRDVMLVIPNWIDDQDNPHCGYTIDMKRDQGQRVEYLTKDFERPDEFVFIDDTRRNGVHAQLMWNFWTQNQGSELPESRVKIVNFAPKNVPV